MTFFFFLVWTISGCHIPTPLHRDNNFFFALSWRKLNAGEDVTYDFPLSLEICVIVLLFLSLPAWCEISNDKREKNQSQL